MVVFQLHCTPITLEYKQTISASLALKSAVARSCLFIHFLVKEMNNVYNRTCTN